MVTFIIAVGVFAFAFFLIVVVYPVLAKKLSPNLKRLNGRLDHKGVSLSTEWTAKLNKVAEVTESESPLPSESATKQLSVPSTSQNARIKQLEDKVAILNKQLLGTATVASTTAAQILDSERILFFQSIRDQAYKDVSSAQPDSDIIATTSPFVADDIRIADKVWVKRITEVQPGNFSSSSEIPPEESQQSKP